MSFFSLYFIVDISHFNCLRLSHELHTLLPFTILIEIQLIEKKLKNREPIYLEAKRKEIAQYAICFLSYRTHVMYII